MGCALLAVFEKGPSRTADTRSTPLYVAGGRTLIFRTSDSFTRTGKVLLLTSPFIEPHRRWLKRRLKIPTLTSQRARR